jgi:hypothetical protein
MTSSASRKTRAAKAKADKRLARDELILEFTYTPGALAYHGPVITTDLTSHRRTS